MSLLMSIARSLVEDRAQLYRFVVADGRRIGQPEFDDIDQGVIDGAATKLDTLTLGEQFVYEFDFADSSTHLCTVAPTRIDPATNWESFRAVRRRVGSGKQIGSLSLVAPRFSPSADLVVWHGISVTYSSCGQAASAGSALS